MVFAADGGAVIRLDQVDEAMRCDHAVSSVHRLSVLLSASRIACLPAWPRSAFVHVSSAVRQKNRRTVIMIAGSIGGSGLSNRQWMQRSVCSSVCRRSPLREPHPKAVLALPSDIQENSSYGPYRACALSPVAAGSFIIVICL